MPLFVKLFRFKLHRDPNSQADYITLERAGRGRIDQVVKSARSVPWSLTLLQLLWTAGPVTYLAMHGGYWLGFGHAAPKENLIFFFVFTILAGIIGLVARFASDLTSGRRQQEARRNLTRTIDLLPDLIFATRDLALAQLPPDARRREAAAALLRTHDLGPESVALGVEELTGDHSLARIAESIEIYRRLGLFSRVQDLVDVSEGHRAAALEKIHASAPDAADVLRDRLNGVAPSQEQGVPRGDNFIERILAAADQDDLTLMTLSDVEDLLVLVLELMSDREIMRLTFSYEGDWRLARALDEVERARNEYRLTQAMALSHLRALATYLVDSSRAALQEEALLLPTQALLESILSALERLVMELEGTPRNTRLATQTREVLRGALRLLKLLQRETSKINSKYQRFQRALGRLEILRRDYRESGQRVRGLRVKERSVYLSDAQKLEVAEAFASYISELKIRSVERGICRGETPFTVEDTKRLAIRLTLIVEPFVDLAEPSIQRAIYSSNAAYFGGLEVGLSADEKAGLAAAVVKEVRQDLGRMAERLALRLARVYQIPLSVPMIEWLVEHYGANRDRLELIATTVAESPPAKEPSASPRGPELPMDTLRWKRLNQEALRILESG